MGQVVPFKRKGAIVNKDSISKVNSRPVAAFYADREGHFDFVNGEWCRLAACLQSDACGDGWLNAVHPDDRLQAAKYWHDAVKGERLLSITFRLAGTWPLRVIFQALPQYDADGCCIGFSGTLTALETAGQKLPDPPARSLSKASAQSTGIQTSEISAPELRLRQAIDRAGLYYFEHDLMAGTTYRSKPLRSLFGGNRNVAELKAAIHPEDAPKFWGTHDSAQANRTLWANEYRVNFPGCETMLVKSQGLFSYDSVGTPAAIYGFTMLAADWDDNCNSSVATLLRRIKTTPV